MLFENDGKGHFKSISKESHLRLKNEKLFREYESITRGKVKDPSTLIQKDFQSTFVITDHKHEEFIKKVEKSKHFEKRFSDEFTSVYEITP